MCKSGTHQPYSVLSTPGPDAQEQEQHDWQSQVAQRGQVGGRRPCAPGLEATPSAPAAAAPAAAPPATRGRSGRSARGIRPGDGHVGRDDRPCKVGDRGLERIGTAAGTRVAKRRGAAPIRCVHMDGAGVRARAAGEVDVRACQGSPTAVREGGAHRRCRPHLGRLGGRRDRKDGVRTRRTPYDSPLRGRVRTVAAGLCINPTSVEDLPGICVRRGHTVHRHIDLGDNVGIRAYTCPVHVMRTHI